jgi:hypothetical protein
MLLFYRPARPRPNTADTLAGGLGQLGQSLGARFGRTPAHTDCRLHSAGRPARNTQALQRWSVRGIRTGIDLDSKGWIVPRSLGGRWSGQSGQRVVPRLRSGSKSVRYNGALYGFEEKRIVGRADRARLEGDAR